MTITLNHTIVPARDKRAAAQFFACIFGLHADSKGGRFAPVRICSGTVDGVLGSTCCSMTMMAPSPLVIVSIV
jgi:hypothetical protein